MSSDLFPVSHSTTCSTHNWQVTTSCILYCNELQYNVSPLLLCQCYYHTQQCNENDATQFQTVCISHWNIPSCTIVW